jgi:hypothetical protein
LLLLLRLLLLLLLLLRLLLPLLRLLLLPLLLLRALLLRLPCIVEHSNRTTAGAHLCLDVCVHALATMQLRAAHSVAAAAVMPCCCHMGCRGQPCSAGARSTCSSSLSTHSAAARLTHVTRQQLLLVLRCGLLLLHQQRRRPLQPLLPLRGVQTRLREECLAVRCRHTGLLLLQPL